MSKERARRREAREREAAARAAAREAAARRRDHRRALLAPATSLVRRLRPAGAGRQTGPLAERRRTRIRLLVMSLVFAQVVVWLIRPDWQARLGALVLSLFAVPVLAAFTL